MNTLRRTAEWGISPYKQSDKLPSTEVSHSSKQAVQEAGYTCWPIKALASSKWSSFIEISLPVTGGFSSPGSGPRLIPVVLPAVESEQWLGNAKPVSLSANSLSQYFSFHLSVPIAIITGDYRQISYPVKTTLVGLLGYNTAILYPSYFPLSLSGPPISNPPTSNSYNYVITSSGSSLSGPSISNPLTSNTNYVITSTGSSLSGPSISNPPISNYNYVTTCLLYTSPSPRDS